MARDCWTDANRLADTYSKQLLHDFWVLYAAKPHATQPNAIVCGWEVIGKRPPAAMVGVIVFKWDNKEKKLTVEEDLSLPYDVPISDAELSKQSSDFIPTVEVAAKRSGSILLA